MFSSNNVFFVLDGDKIEVTPENREEYVKLYINHILNSCCKYQFDAFKQGFLKVVNKQVLQLFQAKVNYRTSRYFVRVVRKIFLSSIKPNLFFSSLKKTQFCFVIERKLPVNPK